jgi:hypothetical protein
MSTRPPFSARWRAGAACVLDRQLVERHAVQLWQGSALSRDFMKLASVGSRNDRVFDRGSMQASSRRCRTDALAKKGWPPGASASMSRAGALGAHAERSSRISGRAGAALTKRERAVERLTRKRAARGRITPALVAFNISDDAQTRPGTSPFPAHVCCFTKLGDAPTRLPRAAERPPGRARWHLVPQAAFEIFKRENCPTMTGWSSDEVRSDLRLRW